MAARLTTHGVDACPDPEAIAAFVDDRLDAREREMLAGHLASCETCYFMFKEAALLTPAAERLPSEQPWWTERRWVAVAGGLAAAATLVVGVALGVMYWPREDAGQLDMLVTAVGNNRLIEPRLTGGFTHASLPSALRSTQPTVVTASPDVRIAAARIEKEMASSTSAAALRMRGLASLLTGDVDAGVSALEQAVAQGPNDARISSDLAAAYLVRGRRRGDAADVSRALAAANRALSSDATLAEARFNQALALERLGMPGEARAAWQAYLELDRESGWAIEARAHLNELPRER